MEKKVMLAVPEDVPWKRESPTIFLKGENLEYYRNIEYLKEVTRQAGALLDRSNAKYENILDNKKLGYRVRAKSISLSAKSESPVIEGLCKKCGLSHGAAGFCIVEQIMGDEKLHEDKRKSKVSKGSFKDFSSLDIKSLGYSKQWILSEEEVPPPISMIDKSWQKINVLEKMSPNRVLDTYATLCARYGPNSGRTFLLANSLANRPEGKIEQWTTPRSITKSTHRSQFQNITRTCPQTTKTQQNLFRTDMSEEVEEKMSQLVDLITPSDTLPMGDQTKEWRAVFNHQPKKRDHPRAEQSHKTEEMEFDSSLSAESCDCKSPSCVCGTETICTTPKMNKCTLIDNDDTNNYLLTMRNQLDKQRETKKRQDTLIMSRMSSIFEVKARARSEEFVDHAKIEHEKALKNCLINNLNDESINEEELKNNVAKIVEITTQERPINARQWDHWQGQMAEQEKVELEDEADSLPSDAGIEEEDESIISHSSVDGLQRGRIKSSRIPHADEVYDLIDKLYNKITRKFEKCIVKNSNKISRLSLRPTFAYCHNQITLKSCTSPLQQDITRLASFPTYYKRLTPFHQRKMRKLKRLKTLEQRLLRTQRRREKCQGLQSSKQYRKVRHSWIYHPQSGYVGFTPREQQLLDPNMKDRFGKFGFKSGSQGKAMSKKRIHHDFRLMCNVFEDAAKANREDLMDQGMLHRYYKFQKKMYSDLPSPPTSDSGSEGDEGVENRMTQKEDSLLLQRANIGRWNPTNSDSVPCENKTRHSKQAERSNSVHNLEKESTKARLARSHNIPFKCTSSTNVHGEKRKRITEPTKAERGNDSKNSNQNLSKRTSIKSLTNLLPPLRHSTEKSMTSNEFEETISALQSELSNLMNKQSERDLTKSNANKANVTSTTCLISTGRKARFKHYVNDESLPPIKQKESVENLNPRTQMSGRGLTKKTSLLSIQTGKTKSLGGIKLPLLAEETKRNELKSANNVSKRAKKKIPTIPKSSFKAWR